jgi:flagellar protein FlaG
MATHSIANVALLVSTASSGSTSGSAGIVAEQRQVIAASTAEVQTREIEVTQEQLEEAVSHLKEYVQNQQREMDFSVDDQTGRFVVKVYDSQTKELIRQIPSEEMLAISRHLIETLEQQEEAKGFLIELKA